MFKTLVKANDDLISFCRCETAYAIGGQADCPWCGCGWLFTCLECGKAFTFAKIVCTEVSPQELARKDLRNWGVSESEIEQSDIDEIAEWLKEQTAPLEVGEVCALLDGSVIPISRENITFDGWKSRHALARLPQVEALTNPEILKTTISSVDYWIDRELDEDEDKRDG